MVVVVVVARAVAEERRLATAAEELEVVGVVDNLVGVGVLDVHLGGEVVVGDRRGDADGHPEAVAGTPLGATERGVNARVRLEGTPAGGKTRVGTPAARVNIVARRSACRRPSDAARMGFCALSRRLHQRWTGR